MSYRSSGYLNVYAVILFILASPGAQRKTTIDAASGLTVMMVHECNSCYGLGMWRGGSPGITQLVARGRGVYTPMLQITSSWGVQMLRKP